MHDVWRLLRMLEDNLWWQEHVQWWGILLWQILWIACVVTAALAAGAHS